jgi:hypothetical protein
MPQYFPVDGTRISIRRGGVKVEDPDTSHMFLIKIEERVPSAREEPV